MVVDHICVNYGAELFQELFNAIQDHRIEQNVFYPRNSKHRIADPDRPYRIDSPLVLSALTKISFSRKRFIMRQQYEPLFLRNKPDLLHAHTLFSDGSLAYDFFRQYHIPYLVAIRSSDLDVFLKFKPWLLSLGRQIVENARNIIFISPSIRRKFLDKFGDSFESKSLILPNGINQSFFQNKAPVKRKPQIPPELLYVGSFLKRKEVPALIKHVEKTGARLSIVGHGGSQEKKVLKMIRKSDKITFLGRVDDPSRLIQIYRQSDIFVMTSRRETFGLVYLEAMSQGLPLIYSKNTGIDGLFEEGSVGYGISPGSVSGMKEATEKILSDYSVISGNCVSQAHKYNWTSIAESYMALYSDVRG
ncbi:MAG: glycosyltransferase [Bacteroidales bacterium]|nr:glycosyltransferase [Bacteroidales bacterium]